MPPAHSIYGINPSAAPPCSARPFLPPIADLLAFEAAARHTSISRAAEELHLTQSAVSRQIRQLEEQLGTALFHRVRQRVVLTDAGRIYAADVQAVLQQLSASTQKTMAFASTDGLLNLAVLPTLGTRWLIPRLGASWPCTRGHGQFLSAHRAF